LNRQLELHLEERSTRLETVMPVQTRLIGKIQNKDILIAAHALAHYPLIISVGVEADTALAGWRREAKFLIVGGSLSVLAICGIFFLNRAATTA